MTVKLSQSGYFEAVYQGPWKGNISEVPENMMDDSATPNMSNFLFRQAEIRTRPRMSVGILGSPDGYPIDVINTFLDGNNVYHTVIVTRSGLFQLNPNVTSNTKKPWNQIGAYPVQPGPDVPAAFQVFVNKIFWTNGNNNLWTWDGISSIGTLAPWPKSSIIRLDTRIIDSNGNVEICTQAGNSGMTVPTWPTSPIGTVTTDTATNNPAQWTLNGKPAPSNGFWGSAVVDATQGITSGAFFLGTMNSSLIMASTVEGIGETGQSFAQRFRWSPSGITNIWDPAVNLAAGYVDFLEVPDIITGLMTIGNSTGFVFRSNGITEVTNTGNGQVPFNFNHLWASDRGIGNVLPFTVAQYGPIGMFVAYDDLYNVSLGGFQRIGGGSKSDLMRDLNNAVSSRIATIIPRLSLNYVYLLYLVAIPLGKDTKFWIYSVDDKSWSTCIKRNCIVTAQPHYVAVT